MIHLLLLSCILVRVYSYEMQELVTSQGYFFESHSVTTQDGYILNIFRIKLNDNVPIGTPVAFMQHGLADSSEVWVLRGNDLAPAF